MLVFTDRENYLNLFATNSCYCCNNLYQYSGSISKFSRNSEVDALEFIEKVMFLQHYMNPQPHTFIPVVKGSIFSCDEEVIIFARRYPTCSKNTDKIITTFH